MPYLAPILDAKGVAALLKISPQRFDEIRAGLEQRGFPRPLDLIGNWAREAIEAWVSKQAHANTAWGRLLQDIEDRPAREQCRPRAPLPPPLAA